MPHHASSFSPRRRALLAAGALACSPAFAQGPRREWPRQRATPAVELSALDGASWRLAEARGRPVLLNFWASWCEPCRTEMPALQRVAAAHQAQGLQLLAVNFKENEAKVRRFIAATGLALPVLLDAEGSVAKAFDVRIFPSTVGVGRDGRVRYVVTGEFDWDGAQARRWVEELAA